MSTVTEAQRAFNRLAAQGVAAGLIPRREVAVICRAGHGKEIYWARHLIDLEAILAERAQQPKPTLHTVDNEEETK